MSGIEQLLSLMKVPLRYFIGIAAVTGFILLAPSTIISPFGLLAYRDKGKLYFGIAFFVLSAVIIANTVQRLAHMNNSFFAMWARKKRLHRLTAEEVQILRQYIEGQTRTNYLDINDGVVSGLISEAIIYRSANVSTFFTTFAHNIQPWAWNYLNKHRNLLGLH
jgi:hypothetical protein